eukprot:3566949-Prymnesium_polylepis.1
MKQVWVVGGPRLEACLPPWPFDPHPQSLTLNPSSSIPHPQSLILNPSPSPTCMWWMQMEVVAIHDLKKG